MTKKTPQKYNTKWLNRPWYQFAEENYPLTTMYEPIIDGVPRNLRQITEIDWDKFQKEEKIGYFEEDGLEVLSNILANPQYTEKELNTQMIINTYKNKTYRELAEHIDKITHT